MNRFWSWLAFSFGALYFLLPLLGTLEFSLKMRRGVYSLDAYRAVLSDPQFQQTFGFSVVMALFTIAFGMLLVVPTAYWVRLRLPKLRPFIEFITLMPLVIPPIVIVFGYIRIYNTSSLLPMTGSTMGTNLLLMFGYTTLSLPYMYRAVDTGLRTIDVATLTEAAQSLGAGWVTILARVIMPNVLIAVLSGAFVTFAIVIGEFVLAARSIGTPPRRVILRHILPNVISPVMVAATLGIAEAIITESVLSFLGLGFPPDFPTWGRLLFDGLQYMQLYPERVIWPGLAISLTVLSVNYIGDGLRDALDPKARGR